mgnify:CR=1 FL=1
MNLEDYTEEVRKISFDVTDSLGVRYPYDSDMRTRLLDTIRDTIEDVRGTDIISLDRYIDYVMDNETHDYVIYNWEIVQSFARYQLWGTDYEDRHRGQMRDMMSDIMAMVNDFYSDVVIETARLVWDDIKEEE